AEVLETLYPMPERRVGARDGPALARVKQLRRMKTEHRRVAERADAAAVDPDAEGVRAVIDEPQAPAPCHGGQSVDIARDAVDVHAQDGGRLRCHERVDALRIDREPDR